MDFATRLTSVGTEDGSLGGSVKIGGTAPDMPDNNGPENIANDDSMFVRNDKAFDPDVPDFINGFSTSLFDNDTTDAGLFTGAIIDVAGQAFTDGIVVAGSNGGQRWRHNRRFRLGTFASQPKKQGAPCVGCAFFICGR